MARTYRTMLSDLVDKRLYIKGWTRSDLAAHMGVCYQHLNNILVGRGVPSLKASERMAQAIGEDPQKLRQLALRNREARRREREQSLTA